MRRAFELLHSARFSPPVEPAEACAAIVKRFELDLRRARVRCGFARGHLLDVVVYVPGGLGNANEREAAEELTWLLLGGELFERWVGRVSVTPATRGGPLTVLNTNAEERSALPVAELYAAVTAAVDGLRRGLSKAPLSPCAQEEDWVLFELDPEPAPDYAAQDDLLISSTRLPELKKSFLRGEPFFSGRFSGAGELFAYLKYESRVETSEARLAERAQIEARLTERLASAHGAVFGTGLGLRYSYLDLALCEQSSVENAILPILRETETVTRGWLLFCDAELEREWRGLHPDTPEPFWGER